MQLCLSIHRFLLCALVCFGSCISKGRSFSVSNISISTRRTTRYYNSRSSHTHVIKKHPRSSNFPVLAQSGNPNEMVLAEDEPLSSKFQRAVVLQRAGDHISALKEYETFIKAAESCDVSPELYAEVHVNMGAIYTKLKDRNAARNNFQKALRYRELGSAHVNLALLALADGQMSRDPSDGITALKDARMHCQQALEIDDDVNSVNGARRLLKDVEHMLQQSGEL